ncbi:hypothetical protein LZ30DRAFT_217786 [Colletotrichum cereale]|nr:hypothetical protein LZ30DRAFT_217786 [Colletotrichum cereale]
MAPSSVQAHSAITSSRSSIASSASSGHPSQVVVSLAANPPNNAASAPHLSSFQAYLSEVPTRARIESARRSVPFLSRAPAPPPPPPPLSTPSLCSLVCFVSLRVVCQASQPVFLPIRVMALTAYKRSSDDPAHHTQRKCMPGVGERSSAATRYA